MNLAIDSYAKPAAVALVTLMLSGCAQHWSDTSGSTRNENQFLADSQQCKMAIYGTVNRREAWAKAQMDSAGHAYDTMTFRDEDYFKCMNSAGWKYTAS